MSSLKFHHFGLAVRQPKKAIAFLTCQEYRIGEPVYDPIQNVNLILCTHEAQPCVEIVYPAEGKSPVDQYVQRHDSGIIYHLCFETEDLASDLEALPQKGLLVVCLSEPSPAVLFQGRKVSFYNVAGMGLIEILEPAPAPA